jgi:hypothetical protein
MTVQGYDLVGDIHGHADALHRPLSKLGNAGVEGVFRHPERRMIFVGDFIDRGPQQMEVPRIARACERGKATAVRYLVFCDLVQDQLHHVVGKRQAKACIMNAPLELCSKARSSCSITEARNHSIDGEWTKV